MPRMRSLVSCAALLAVACLLVGRAYAADAGDKEAKLIAVLQSDAPPAEKAMVCRHLAVCGTKAAVPALAALLSNKDLASWARIGLEPISDPAVDEALREAVGKLQGRLLIGVINSIGIRRDPKAVETLAAKLKDADAEVASAAAEALGRIGGEPAAKVLEPPLADAPAAVRPSVAYGCILVAERFLTDKKADEAVKLYDAVRKADVPKQRILEATRGAILARGAAGVPLLVEQLKSADKGLFAIALRTARELPGSEATDALVAEFGKATPERQPLLLMALADRGDAKAVPAALEAAKSGPTKVRVVAMGLLERIGNASCVPVLLDAALDADAELVQAAKAALARLPGQDVDPDVQARLAKASGKMRQALIELAAQRRIEAALPAIVASAEDPDAGVRGAAIDAIGALGGEKQVADLAKLIEKANDPKAQAGLEKALTAISARAGAACVPALAPLAKSGEAPVRIIALHALACAGGPDALAAVKSAIDDKDEAVQDEVVRTLSTWPNKWPEDVAATEPLLALAKSAKKPPHQILALRGYLQYVQGTKKTADADRLAKVNEVLPLVTRAEEKRLAISVLGTIAAAGALEKLGSFAAEPGISEEACSAIVSLVGKQESRAIPKEQRQQALQTAIEKAKSGALRKKAQETLKAIQ